jgi:hypothetical protein
MRADSLYRLSVACLVTHEIESSILPHLNPVLFASSIQGSVDQQIFLWAHAPILLGLILMAEASRSAAFRYGICVFALAHAGLHWVYRDTPVYDFSSMASWVLILLAGIFGAAYLVPAKAR